MNIKSVGVIGAGQMGNGIAHVFALAGYDVYVNDVSADALNACKALIEKNIARQVARGKITATEQDAALARLHMEMDIAVIGSTDLIIEAATEREEIKHQIFANLAPHLGENTILTSNTSSISITRLGSGDGPA